MADQIAGLFSQGRRVNRLGDLRIAPIQKAIFAQMRLEKPFTRGPLTRHPLHKPHQEMLATRLGRGFRSRK